MHIPIQKSVSPPASLTSSNLAAVNANKSTMPRHLLSGSKRRSPFSKSPLSRNLYTRIHAASNNGGSAPRSPSPSDTISTSSRSNASSSAIEDILSNIVPAPSVSSSPTHSSAYRAGAAISAPAALHLPEVAFTADEIFVCPEESLFYSQCLEKLLVNHQPGVYKQVIEFGAGDGTPVINCLLKTHFNGHIHGYELNPSSHEVASGRVQQYNLASKYTVHNGCFFKGMRATPAATLIANPPYIPAPDSDILMPALHGGTDGANLTRDLLSLGFPSCVLLISAYSNPVLTVQHAQQQGYKVVDFMVTSLPFGFYSSEPKVLAWLGAMRERGEAFYSASMYLLAGVLFVKDNDGAVDLSEELLKVLTAL